MFHARSLSLRRIGPPDVPRLTLTTFPLPGYMPSSGHPCEHERRMWGRTT